MGGPTGGVNSSSNAQPLNNATTETIGTTTAPVPTKEVQQHQDSQVTARSKKAMVHHGTEIKSYHSMQTDILKKDLSGQVPVQKDPPFLSNPTFDLPFYEKMADLAEKNPKQLQQWFEKHPEYHKNLRENYSLLGDRKLDSGTEAKLKQLGDTLQRFHNEHWAAEPMKKYAELSRDEIAKDFVDRIKNAEEENGAAGRKEEIKNIVSDLRLLASSGDRKAERTYARAMAGFQQALRHEEPYTNIKGNKRTMELSEAIEQIGNLEGPGSADVKADMIKKMVDQKRHEQIAELETKGIPKEMIQVIAESTLDKENKEEVMKKLEKLEKLPGQAQIAYDTIAQIKNEPYPGEFVEKLIKNDPLGVAHEMEYRARVSKDPQLLGRALDSIYRAHRKDPDKAVEIIGGMLGDAAKELTIATQQKPIDQARIEELGHSTGFLLQSAKNMVSTMARDKEKMIDEGAFIAGIFTKAVSKLSGVPGIDKIGGEIIDGLKKDESEGVQKWEGRMVNSYKDLLNKVFFASKPHAGPGSQEMQQFETDLNKYWTTIRLGIEDQLELEGKLYR